MRVFQSGSFFSQCCPGNLYGPGHDPQRKNRDRHGDLGHRSDQVCFVVPDPDHPIRLFGLCAAPIKADFRNLVFLRPAT